MDVGDAPLGREISRAEGWAAAAYFGVYLAYLFQRPESEFAHWLTLVLLPLVVVALLRRAQRRPLAPLLPTFGLRRTGWTRGLVLAVVVGLIIGLYQATASRSAATILELGRSGRALFLFPLAFILMLLTAGFTEEFFFRGFLQTRLEALLHSRIAALLAASAAFGLYHLPYAYLNPAWPSAGDWGAAWMAALGQGIPGGLILGGVYLLSGRNLVAAVVLHSLINAFPAMGMLNFG